VFAKIPRRAIPKLQKRYFFYVWNEKESVVRWMCSWDTSEADVKRFAEYVGETV
jgi:threonine aldolase